MENNWLQIPTNRKPSRALRLCLLLGIAGIAFLIALPGVGASGVSGSSQAITQQD